MAITLNTNSAAYIALTNLRTVGNDLQASEKRISTGFHVSDALDNGAVFGVAQLVRSAIAANIAVSQELGNFSGLVQTASAAATQISNNLSDIRGVLSHLSSTALDSVSLGQYATQLQSLVASVKNYINGAQYGETNLLSTMQSFSILVDHQAGNSLEVTAGEYNINTAFAELDYLVKRVFSLSDPLPPPRVNWNDYAIFTALPSGVPLGGSLPDLNFDPPQAVLEIDLDVLAADYGSYSDYAEIRAAAITYNAAAKAFNDYYDATPANAEAGKSAWAATNVGNFATYAQSYLAGADIGGVSGGFETLSGSISTVLNNVGALNRALSTQINFNATVQNGLRNALGSLVDADLQAESAQLTALQVKQSLSTQALSIANRGPNSLLRLFQ